MYQTILTNPNPKGGIMLIQVLARAGKFYVKYIACDGTSIREEAISKCPTGQRGSYDHNFTLRISALRVQFCADSHHAT